MLPSTVVDPTVPGDLFSQVYGGPSDGKLDPRAIYTPTQSALDARARGSLLARELFGSESVDGIDVDAALAALSEDELTTLYRLALSRNFGSWVRVLDQSRPLTYDAPHFPILFDAIQDVVDGRCERLIVNLPPRSGKSNLVTIRLSLYLMEQKSPFRVVLGCYNKQLSREFSRETKALARERNIPLSREQARMDYWRTQKGSSFQAVGVGSGVVGFGANCFPARTMVATITGDKPIESLKPGDSVFGWHPPQHGVVVTRVEACRVRESSEFVDVDACYTSLRMTPEHPVWVDKAGFIHAEQIKAGMVVRLLRPASERTTYSRESETVMAPVSKCERMSLPKAEPVYDIQVEGTHNFFANGILVHNCIIVDDPIKDPMEAKSEAYRNRVWDWFRGALYTRRQPGAPVVVVSTRWSHDDLCGRLIKQMEAGEGDAWRVINIPALAEEGREDGTGRTPGQALFPQAGWTVSEYQKIRRSIGPKEFSAQYQGKPQQEAGAKFRSEWFGRYDVYETRMGVELVLGGDKSRTYVASELQTVVTVDLAASTKQQGDWTVFSVWQIGKRKELILRHVYRDQLEGPDVVDKARQVQSAWRPSIFCVEKNGLGLPIVQHMAREGLPVRGISQHKDKNARADGAAARYELGLVYHPSVQPAWLLEFENELLEFPYGGHDDCVDTASMAAQVIDGGRGFFDDDFSSHQHVASVMRDPVKIVVGWGLHPAPAVVVVEDDGGCANVHAAMVGDIGQGIEQFAREVATFIAEAFSKARKVTHVGPEELWGRGVHSREGRSARKLILGDRDDEDATGILVVAGRSTRREREAWIRERLVRLQRGTPLIQIHEQAAAQVIESLAGGYQKRYNTVTGQVSEDPEKTWHVGVVEALGHALSRIPGAKARKQTLEDEEDAPIRGQQQFRGPGNR